MGKNAQKQLLDHKNRTAEISQIFQFNAKTMEQLQAFSLITLSSVFLLVSVCFFRTGEESEKRRNTYDTLPRSLSEVSLRETTAIDEGSLSRVREEEEEETPLTSLPEEEQSKDEKAGQMQSSQELADKKPSLKLNSLVTLGLVKGHHPTQFDEEDEEAGEDEIPGAFKRPKSAYKLAR